MGFGFGDAVIVELLQLKNLLPDLTKAGIEVLACPLGEEQRAALMKVVSALRAQGVGVDLVLEKKKAKWAFHRADKMGVRYVLVMGDEEAQGGYVTVKDLKEGKQGRYTVQEVVDMIRTT
ncbi:hypothetical protein EON65_24385 [archaeon]|nr:MAG: hypothetical protein EON65_24385 [archaeon]